MRFSLLTILLLLLTFIHAQNTDTTVLLIKKKVETRYDTTYIYQFKRNFAVRAIIVSKKFNLIIAPKNIFDNNDELKINYKPNIGYYYGFGGSYRNIYGQILFTIPNSQKSKNEFGSTQHTDFNISFHHDKLNETFFYQKYKGWYATKDYLGNTQNIIREDIELLKTGIRVFYQFNEQFSIHSVYKQTQLQKKSTGAWIVRLDAYYQRITADSTILLTPEQNEYYSEFSSFWKAEYYVLNFQLGYAYNFSFAKYFFISPFIFAGLGPQQVQYNNSDTKKYAINYAANLKVFAGYTRKRFYTGIIYDTQYHFTPTNSATIYTNTPFIQFSAGYRFNLRKNTSK